MIFLLLRHDSYLYVDYAKFLEDNGHFEEAGKHYREAFELFPDDEYVRGEWEDFQKEHPQEEPVEGKGGVYEKWPPPDSEQ